MYECRYEYSPYGNGYEVEEDVEAYCVPIFTDVRVDFSDTKVSPYLDFRLGAAVGDDVSAYVSGSTGVRIAFSPKTALSIGLVIDYFGQEVLEGYDNHGLAGLRVGFEF